MREDQPRDRAESGLLNHMMASTPNPQLGAPKHHDHGQAPHSRSTFAAPRDNPLSANISASITPMASRRFSGRIEYNIALPPDIPNRAAAAEAAEAASRNEEIVADRHVCDLVGTMYEDEEPEPGFL